MYENAGPFARYPLIDVVCRNFCEQKATTSSPNWTFSPLRKAGRHALQLRIGRNQAIESWVKFLDIL
jgi:hypothetical protein